ncbi:MAG: diguanylate cyclase [Desulfobulbaceae bacterium]|mgnify:FL=1|nr:MAG: diguanylate cyclase [Desulfobulbaceae bacterium]
MMVLSEQNIQKISFIYSVIAVGLLTFSIGALFISQQIKTLDQELVKTETEFFNRQRQVLKHDIETTIKRIDSRRISMEKIQRTQMQRRVANVITTVEHMQKRLASELDQSVVQRAIIESLRPHLSNDEGGTIFIMDLSGAVILSPPLEEATVLGGILNQGSIISSRFISAVTEKKRTYLTIEPAGAAQQNGEGAPTVYYGTLFEPYGWLVGSALSDDALKSLARTRITRDLRNSFRDEGNSYHFIYQLHDLDGGAEFATMLMNKNRPDLVGKKISDEHLDSRGKPFRKEFMQGIRDIGEAFVIYWYQKMDGTGEGRKLSYFKHYPQWNWVVARGVHLDSLDEMLALKKEAIKKQLIDDSLKLLLIFLAALALTLLVAYQFSKGLRNIFKRYHSVEQQQRQELEELNKTLEQQSHTDALTAIYNRAFFNRQLDYEMKRAGRYDTPLSLIMLDIDHFKIINDHQGHLVGDEILVELTRLTSDNVRQSDFFARWGGEEFVILTPGVELAHALDMAEKLRILVETHQFPLNNRITCSFGVSEFQVGEVEKTLLQRVDNALYRAKEGGRNRVVSLS